MKNILLIIIVCMVGCSKTEYGNTMTEQGEIFETCYVPAGHGSGSTTGFTTGGHVHFGTTDVDIPARYAVVFKCQHGKFVIDGERGESLYKQFEKGNVVTISYCRKFEVSSDRTNCVGLHFLGAKLNNPK